MIDVVDVTHHFHIRPVLCRVNLRIEKGEVVSLMGPNGMGKSTLMAIMAGALWPLEGRVEIDGVRRRNSPDEELAIRKKVVYLPADAWLPRRRSAREWLLAVGRLYGIHDERLLEHVPRLLSLFNLDAQADQPIAACSAGQRKKVALAGAIVTEAPIMLLDEPFAGGLDPSGILALKRIFQRHREQKDRTIVIATPVPELVEDVSDRVAILKAGKIAAFDTMEGLRNAAGGEGRLDEVYERLAGTGSMDAIARYFQEGA